MERLETLYSVTKQLVDVLTQLEDPNLDRDNLIEDVNVLIDKREQILKGINKPYTQEELQIGGEIIQLNEQVKVKMNLLYEDIKNDMKQVQKKKEQNYSYLHPYGKIKTTDGMYMDSKL